MPKSKEFQTVYRATVEVAGTSFGMLVTGNDEHHARRNAEGMLANDPAMTWAKVVDFKQAYN